MRLLHKRLLVMFSVALNIGFVIMAAVMFYQHSISFHERSFREIAGMVHRLDLPEGKERAILDNIRQFRGTFDKHHEDIKAARADIIRQLAESGPLDQDRLNELVEAANQREKIKNQAFEAHVIDLRRRLGDENGARFFSLLLAHLNDRDNDRPR